MLLHKVLPRRGTLAQAVISMAKFLLSEVTVTDVLTG